MGKKKNSSTAAAAAISSQPHLQQAPSGTMREESSGKKQSSVNPKSMLKLDHLKNLAIWATAEASVCSLGAFFGHRLAATAEALGVPPDPSLFSCQRCESILQPGYNCTVRIEKIKPNPKRRRKKRSLSIENSVVYSCHFCSHRNLKRGTPKGYMKELCPSKPKVSSKSDPTKSSHPKFAKAKVITASKNDPMSKVDGIASQKIINKDPANDSSTTPSAKVETLLDTRKRKRTRSGSKKIVESESSSVPVDAKKASIPSSKRKRKSWTSLKDIAECSDQDSSRNFTNLAIPFRI
ncbi:uncharacterized protein [Coffea arabica]|uniref:Uncharacterized protein LOC113712889 n=1 Tax=Coffea arabica TaxID=13443 RepID=A0A6P6UP97_COFAR|nr:uncharacterized protein LOC113712889 [Coffea arabica]XP_027092306.1 uncharacterized protein LOC113712889 [Coffea arabica]XP_027092307.1 uncharacterized protein LOC113712889 [Coffea arabica]XP_027092308.1 uncharacterized protein LOC113712889 [Coffea arabica]XP_027092309.1 uncharacterized protein LOC113712889 [Coffea arabica]XP_027092310.1 uncharacterized protein LOC113712889 [Coffea arabica]XP_027092311.1 uncharacterized protein LOC113712889 [Coffea arabica]XP_027092312.1 uncharacterized p